MKDETSLQLGEFYQSFLDSTLKTISVLCSTPVTSHRITTTFDTEVLREVVGQVNFSSSTLNGLITLSLSQETYVQLMSKMVNKKHSNITSDIHDGIAEWLNVIFGLAKVKLNNEGHDFVGKIPTVVTSEKEYLGECEKHPNAAIEFCTEFGNFILEFRILLS